MDKKYTLPSLSYDFNSLEPYISEQQLRLHYEKHHQAYINAANSILEKLDTSRKEEVDIDIKAISKELSFNIAGHVLHSSFWENLTSPKSNSSKLDGKIKEQIENDFGSFERFKSEFSKVALSTEGSGWAILTFCENIKKLIILQIEKHNVNLIPKYPTLLVLDVFEHAYYLDYKNERAKFIESFWNIINWEKVNERFTNL